MSWPAVTGSGVSVFVTDRSAEVATEVVEVAALLPGTGSGVELDTPAVLVIVDPFAALAFTFTTIVKVAETPAPSDASVHEAVPVPPTEGVVQLNAGPVFCVSETKVVFAGIESVSTTFA